MNTQFLWLMGLKMLNIDASISMGNVEVFTSDNGGHSIGQVAQMAANKIIYISKDAPPPIRDQAQSFKDSLREILITYMKMAVDQDRATLCAKLRQNGHSELADNLRSL